MLRKTDYIQLMKLLYLEHKLKGTVGSSNDHVKELLRMTKNNDTVYVDGENINAALVNLLMEMLEVPIEDEINLITIKDGLRAILGDDSAIDSFRDYHDLDIAKEELLSLRRLVRSKISKIKFKFSTYELYKLTNKNLDNLSMSELKDLVLKYEESMNDIFKHNANDDKAIMDRLNVDDIKSFEKAMNSLIEEESDVALFKTGYKGINRFYQGGPRRGEASVYTALEHNYKSGITHGIFTSILEFNKPFKPKPHKRPAALFFLFEDMPKKVIATLYELYKVQDGLETKDIDITKDPGAKEYVVNRLKKNGFYVDIVRVDPNEWTYKDVFNYVLDLEARGFDIQLCLMDYLAMLPTTGCKGSGGNGTDLLELFRRIKNFFAKRDTVFITPHQTAPDAQEILRGGMNPFDFVDFVAQRGYYKTTRQLGQEIDFSCFIHIVEHKGRAYLTMKRGKHRLYKNLPERYRYYVLPFPKDQGNIVWDFDKDYEIGTHSKKISDIEALNSSTDKSDGNLDDELASFLAS